MLIREERLNPACRRQVVSRYTATSVATPSQQFFVRFASFFLPCPFTSIPRTRMTYNALHRIAHTQYAADCALLFCYFSLPPLHRAYSLPFVSAYPHPARCSCSCSCLAFSCIIFALDFGRLTWGGAQIRFAFISQMRCSGLERGSSRRKRLCGGRLVGCCSCSQRRAAPGQGA